MRSYKHSRLPIRLYEGDTRSREGKVLGGEENSAERLNRCSDQDSELCRFLKSLGGEAFEKKCRRYEGSSDTREDDLPRYRGGRVPRRRGRLTREITMN